MQLRNGSYGRSEGESWRGVEPYLSYIYKPDRMIGHRLLMVLTYIFLSGPFRRSASENGLHFHRQGTYEVRICK